MKKHQRWTGFAATTPLAALGVLAAIGLTRDGQDAAAPSGASKAAAEVYELTVRREPKTEGVTLFGSAGTEIRVAIHAPGASLLSLNEEETKLVKWADDRGTELAPGEESWMFWAQMDSRWDDDARMDVATLTLRTDKLPDAAASRMALEATLDFVDAGDPTTESTTVALEKGAAFKLAGVDVKLGDIAALEDSDEYAVQIEIQSARSLGALQSLVFADADGNEIESSGYGSSSMSIMGKRSFSYYYVLARQVDSMTLTSTYYARMGSLSVPLKLSLGVGL